MEPPVPAIHSVSPSVTRLRELLRMERGLDDSPLARTATSITSPASGRCRAPDTEKEAMKITVGELARGGQEISVDTSLSLDDPSWDSDLEAKEETKRKRPMALALLDIANIPTASGATSPQPFPTRFRAGVPDAGKEDTEITAGPSKKSMAATSIPQPRFRIKIAPRPLLYRVRFGLHLAVNDDAPDSTG
ncbi:hypothetical protein B0H11DRAFT_1989798 [Mycena galericulata]|nr:hypothetical protein B0H11DRAFT_1989798 [Mycena galericulata]